MFYLIAGIASRIISNSYLNVFQKLLTQKGVKSSIINFYTYAGLSIIGIFFLKSVPSEILPYIAIMGLLGAAGNYFIIKALSIGELSTLAPINSYKPVVALVFEIIFLKETPSLTALFAILLIIFGTYIILGIAKGSSKAILFRVAALICSGTEAVFIKKIILVSGSLNTFILWCISGLIFSTIPIIASKYSLAIKDYKHQFLLIIAVAIMQLSTNIVFERMNVAYALALFQLSTLLSVFLGVKVFKEKEIKKKIIGSIIMITGAVLIILT